jgi:hypothetical protein
MKLQVGDKIILVKDFSYQEFEYATVDGATDPDPIIRYEMPVAQYTAPHYKTTLIPTGTTGVIITNTYGYHIAFGEGASCSVPSEYFKLLEKKNKPKLYGIAEFCKTNYK